MAGRSVPAGASGRPAHRGLGARGIRGHRSRLESPQLTAPERILVRESPAAGTEQVGTGRALYFRDAELAEHAWNRVGWDEVASVGWTRATGTLTFRTWPPQLPAAITVHVRPGSRLPGFAGERVSACRVASRSVRISAECTVTMSAHRDPARGEVTWTVHLDGCGDCDDPDLATAIAHALGGVREQFGC